MPTTLETLEKIDCISAFTLYLNTNYKKQIIKLNKQSKDDANAQFYISKDKQLDVQISIDPISKLLKGTCSCERKQDLCIHQVLLANVLTNGSLDNIPQDWQEIIFMEPVINMFLDGVPSIDKESDCLDLIMAISHTLLNLESSDKFNKLIALYIIITSTESYYLDIFRSEKIVDLGNKIREEILYIAKNTNDVKLAKEFEHILYNSFVKEYMFITEERIELYFELLTELNVLSDNFMELKNLIYNTEFNIFTGDGAREINENTFKDKLYVSLLIKRGAHSELLTFEDRNPYANSMNILLARYLYENKEFKRAREILEKKVTDENGFKKHHVHYTDIFKMLLKISEETKDIEKQRESAYDLAISDPINENIYNFRSLYVNTPELWNEVYI